MDHSEVHVTRYRRHKFPSRFTPADIELLAQVDEAHEKLSGPATKKTLEREWELYQHGEYERLATISVAHIYNLRRRKRYRERRLNYTKTRAVQVANGEQRKPDPQGRPGYIRWSESGYPSSGLSLFEVLQPGVKDLFDAMQLRAPHVFHPVEADIYVGPQIRQTGVVDKNSQQDREHRGQ